ncbi:MAG: hypothetical protein WC054_13765 [Candidatus Nanopelagicales bacterium]
MKRSTSSAYAAVAPIAAGARRYAAVLGVQSVLPARNRVSDV